MKKIVSLFALTIILLLGVLVPQNVYAQDSTSTDAVKSDVETVDEPAQKAPDAVDEPGFTQVLKKRFIEGGIGFMVVVLLCLILGVAIAIERIIYLSLATVNTKSLLQEVEEALNTGGVEAAKEVCRNTRGPVGSIFYEGLSRAEEGPEAIEKSIIAGGSVQMGLLEKGVSWISLFIALAPMLGFLGTVLGMIEAFDAIVEQGGIKATVVADGIKTALITTVAGLIVAIILQVFYNIIVAKIDNLVNSMEDASNSFVRIVNSKIS